MPYDLEQPLAGGWLLRESADEPHVEQVRVLLDAVEREQRVLPDCLQQAFTPWLMATRRWLDLSADAVDDERLWEVADRLKAYKMLIAFFAERRRR